MPKHRSQLAGLPRCACAGHQLVHAAVCIGDWRRRWNAKSWRCARWSNKALSPTDRTVWEKLGLLYVERLSDLVSEERTSEMEAALREIETYYGSMKQQFPERRRA